MEVEVKLRLPDSDAHQKLSDILSPYHIKTHLQQNLFFDTPSLTLANDHLAALRIRFYDLDSLSVLSLKAKPLISDGISRIEEDEETIDPSIARACAAEPSLLSANIQKWRILRRVKDEFGVDLKELLCLGGFRNVRAVHNWNGLKVELDETHYGFGVNYEIECESDDPDRAKSMLEELLNEHGIRFSYSEVSKFAIFRSGATLFLITEYQYVGVFMIVFAILIFLFLGSVEGFCTKSQQCTYNVTRMCKPALVTALFSTISFLLGAITSVLSGFLGMKIATYANARTTLEARKCVGKAFITAFRSGAVMGFLLAANGLLVLYITINLFKLYYGDDWEGLFEAITGYGLGGSSMALFGRVGGGIYTKAADVGADLVGKVERNIPEDDPINPAVSDTYAPWYYFCFQVCVLKVYARYAGDC